MDDRRESRPSASGQALKVLVVDSDAGARRALQQAVMAIGHKCAAASDGLEAWGTLEKHPADVVVARAEMPGLDGAELCRRVRARAGDAYTYFILLDARRDRQRVLEGIRAGADETMATPVDLDELSGRLATAQRIAGHHRRLSVKNQELRRDSQRNYLAARIDPLTCMANRRQLSEDLEALFGTPYRLHHSAALADIDSFKRYNDRFEHQAGDDALCKVAWAMRGALRQDDRLYRYGGEEFLMVFRDQRLDVASQAAERVRRAVEELGLPHPDGPAGVVTISVGVAELTPDLHGADEWIHRADDALYRAKALGKNRVELFRPPLSRRAERIA
jgi:diguanylate cyclase (GGDEF)-like protein